jgi:DNA-binding beta-propeller fold protein YncE
VSIEGVFMTRTPAALASALFAFFVVAVGGGCNFSQSGIAPPTNRVFLPVGVVPDPDGNFLYVVNSNSDLRFNAGTVVAVDLAKASATRANANMNPLPTCVKTRFSRTEPVADDYCCRDLLDSNIINCNEPQFIQSGATIQIGSFGGVVKLQNYTNSAGTAVRRLFMVVRAEPSITYADVTISGGVVSMRCTGSPTSSATQPLPLNPFCEDSWKILRPGGVTDGSLVLPEEPHVMWLDDGGIDKATGAKNNGIGALFVGHLTVTANGQVQGGGVSSIDICNPRLGNPGFAGLARTTFLPATLSQAVGALSTADTLDNSATRVYATARYSSEISEMVLRDPSQAGGCDPNATTPLDSPRDLTLVPGESFYSSAFLPNGVDVRGILFSPDGPVAYVLHRNDSNTTSNPASLVMIDRSLPADGTQPSNAPMDVLPVCNGPTEMQWNQDKTRIYITCYDDGQIFVVDPQAFVVTAIIDAGAGPTSLVFSPSDPGKAYVASFVNSHLSVIDLAEDRVVMRIGLPHAYGE